MSLKPSLNEIYTYMIENYVEKYGDVNIKKEIESLRKFIIDDDYSEENINYILQFFDKYTEKNSRESMEIKTNIVNKKITYDVINFIEKIYNKIRESITIQFEREEEPTKFDQYYIKDFIEDKEIKVNDIKEGGIYYNEYQKIIKGPIKIFNLLQQYFNNEKLFYYINNSDFENVEKLLQETTSYHNIPNSMGFLPVISAIANDGIDHGIDDSKVTKWLNLFLNNKYTDINVFDSHGRVALIYAIEQNIVGVVKKLLDYPDTDIDIKDNNKNTPLMIAIKKDRENIVKLLLEKNARIDLKNNKGQTALDIANKGGRENIVKLLQKNTQVPIDSGIIKSNIRKSRKKSSKRKSSRRKSSRRKSSRRKSSRRKFAITSSR